MSDHNTKRKPTSESEAKLHDLPTEDIKPGEGQSEAQLKKLLKSIYNAGADGRRRNLTDDIQEIKRLIESITKVKD